MGETSSQTAATTTSQTPAGFDYLRRPLGTLLSGYTRANEIAARPSATSTANPTNSDIGIRLMGASLNPQGTANVLENMRQIALGGWDNPLAAQSQQLYNTWGGEAQKAIGQGINQNAARLTKAGQNASSSAFGQLNRQIINDANAALLGKLAEFQKVLGEQQIATRDQQLKAAGGVTSLDILPYEAAVKATQGTNAGATQVSNTTGSNPLFGSK